MAEENGDWDKQRINKHTPVADFLYEQLDQAFIDI